MAKINHIEMGPYIMGLKDIQVKKGFMGLNIKLIYKPTNSVVKIKEQEYTAEDGIRLENILATEPENLQAALQKFPVSSVGMGNIKLEACVSDDHQFVAVQLLSFKDFDYYPISEVKVFTRKAAETISRLF